MRLYICRFYPQYYFGIGDFQNVINLGGGVEGFLKLLEGWRADGFEK